MLQCLVTDLFNGLAEYPEVTGVQVNAREPAGLESAFLLVVEGSVLARQELDFHIELFGPNDSVYRCDPWYEPGQGESAHCYRFRAEVGLVGLPREFSLEVALGQDDSPAEALARIEVSWEGRLPGAGDSVPPLFVTSHGRSGSSYLMSLLTTHPAIVVQGGHPFECRAANYWLHAAKVLTAPASFDGGERPERFHLQPDRVGQMPENSFRRTEDHPSLQSVRSHLLSRTLEYCTGNISDFYAVAASAQDKGAVAYFAEKSLPRYMPWVADVIYPGFREVVLVRDLRDVACSMRAFGERRSASTFGTVDTTDWRSMIEEMKPGAERMLEHWESRRDRAHLLRYEDLISEPGATLQALFQFLGLDDEAANARVIDSAGDSTPGASGTHQTTASPEASVGRWRSEMDDDIAAHATAEFSVSLEAFGYL